MQYEISVIIPVYNTADFLPECVDSVIQEPGFANMQVLLVDDGSADHSVSLIEQYSQKYPNIQLLSYNEPPFNRGMSAARNLGLRNARGTYVFFLDSDDMVSDGYIDALHRAIQEKQCDIVYAGFSRFTGSEKNPVLRRVLSNGDVISSAEYLGRRIDLDDDHNYVWCGLYRRQFLEENRIIFDEDLRLYEDMLFSAHIAQAGGKTATLEHYGYLYRIRPGSSARSGVSAKDLEALLLVMRKLQGGRGVVGRFYYVLVSMYLVYLGMIEEQETMDARQRKAYYTELSKLNLFPALWRAAETRKERMKWMLWRINWRLFYPLVKK